MWPVSVQAVDHVRALGGPAGPGRRLIGAVLCRHMLRRPARVQRPSGEAAHRIVVVAAVIGLGDRLGGRRRLA